MSRKLTAKSLLREIREIKSQLNKSASRWWEQDKQSWEEEDHPKLVFRRPGALLNITFPEFITDPEFKKVNLDMRKLVEKYVPEEKIGKTAGFFMKVYVKDNNETERYTVNFQFDREAAVFSAEEDYEGRLYRKYEKEYEEAGSYKRWINIMFAKWITAEGYKYKKVETYFRGDTMHVNIDFYPK